MLADDVLHREALARRGALVVEDADRRTIVDERVEQDRPCVRDHAVAVLEECRELLEVREARLLHRDSRRSPAPARNRSRHSDRGDAGERGATAGRASGCLPPVDHARDEPVLERRVGGRVPHDDDERRRRIEPERAEKALVLAPRPPPCVDVGLRPAAHHDALRPDAVVAREVVAHRLVLDDVGVAERRDHALADGVIPARDVRDDRQAEPSRSDEERHDGVRLDVREHERAALRPHAPDELMRDVATRAEVPALHRALHAAPARQAAVSVRVEHPVRVPRSHALAVEPVPVVEAHRERVVAEVTVEHPVDPAERSFAVADANRHEIRSVENATPDALRPLAALLGTRKHGDQAIAEALLEATHDPGSRRRAGS